MVKISVVMPVYNTAIAILKEAVDSILAQTFNDFEFIIIDDGSTEAVREYLDRLIDPRIKILHNETNIGITKSLNIGFRAAQGKYIARMDSDDVSLPTRFEKQVAFMESHPQVIACGTRWVYYGKKPEPPIIWMENRENLRVRLLFANCGPVHPTAFFDREILVKHEILYDEQLIYSQDYGMWVTLVQYGDVCTLPETLLIFRNHQNRITKKHREQQIACDQITQRRLLMQLLGDVTDEEVDMHYTHSTGYYKDATITPQVANWYKRLISANKQKELYDKKLLRRHIERIKKTLVYQTIKSDMSLMNRMMLFLRYLSCRTIGKVIRDNLKQRLRRFSQSK